MCALRIFSKDVPCSGEGKIKHNLHGFNIIILSSKNFFTHVFFIKLNIYSCIHHNLLHPLQPESRYCTKQQTEMHVAHEKKNAQQIIFHKHRVTYLLFIIAR